MSRTKRFWDGITSLTNKLANSRSPENTNEISHRRISNRELRAIYKTGLGSKIVRLKSGYAFKDTLVFPEGTIQKEFYEKKLARIIKKASKFQLAFGRGIVVIQIPGQDMSQPLFASDDVSKAILRVFSGDMVTAYSVTMDLEDPRYMKPDFYNVRGVQIHYSRVIDFSYVEPVELELPTYQYGGISEFELIHTQLVNDAIVERSSAHMLEKSSNLFYSVEGFKDQLAVGKEDKLVEYFSRMENLRSIYGAGIKDKEDEIETFNQTLTGLSDADMITLRRLSMVTGIPLAELVGENVKGLNSTGDNEIDALWSMIGAYQSDFLLDPVNDLFKVFGFGPIEFKENQNSSPNDKIEYESKVIDNAIKLQALGEDYVKYLKEKGIDTEPDDFENFFSSEDDDDLEDPFATN